VLDPTFIIDLPPDWLAVRPMAACFCPACEEGGVDFQSYLDRKVE
jgi:hypothetical protein